MMTFKTFLMSAAVLAALPLTACGQAPSAESPASVKATTEQMPVMEAKAHAVLIYADWCSSCKVLDPKVQAAKPMFDGKGLNFVTLDYTDKDEADFLAQAKAAGVATAVMEAQAGVIKTGRLMLVSADGERLISQINMNHTPAEIAAKFKDAIEQG